MDIISETKTFVKSKLYGEGSGHDWWHIQRVYGNCLLLMQREQIKPLNKEVVELAALLHDIADWKFNNGDEDAGPKAARAWLESQHTPNAMIDHVCQIIRDLSFKGAKTQSPMKTKEGKFVQDADRLDAIGAIGIARAFAYGGYKGQELFNPTILPKEHQTAEEYKAQRTTTINHFFEKLLLLKDRMNTNAARKIAQERHAFMLQFLGTFFEEHHEQTAWHARELQNYHTTNHEA